MAERLEITRTELYELVWTKPMTKLAKEFHLSDKGLAKKCIKHHIPRPPVGYWARVDSGQKPKKTPLPNIKDPLLETVHFELHETKESDRLLSNAFEVDPGILEKAREFKLPNSIKKFHHIIRETRKARLDHDDKYGRIDFRWDAPVLGLKVTEQTYSRACLFLESLVRLFDSCGWKFEKQELKYGKRQTVAGFTNGESHLQIEIKEAVQQVDHIPVKRDRQSWYWSNKYDYLPTGILQFSILGPGEGFKRSWKDSASNKIEEHLVEIVESFAKSFEYSRLLKIKREQEHIEWEKREAIRKERIRQEKVEDKRRQLLFTLADNHQKAQSIRALLDSIGSRYEDNPQARDWVEWAARVADTIDPACNIESVVAEHDKAEADISMTSSYY
jgi:hypothetical protein